MTPEHKALVAELLDPNFEGAFQHVRSYSEIDRLFRQAASAIESLSAQCAQLQAGEPTGYIDRQRQKFASIEKHDIATLAKGGWTPVYLASPQPANPAQVTDAMVEAAMSAPPIPGRGPNVFDPDRMRAALTAAIGAGGQAVDQGLRDAAKAMGAEVARSVPVVGSQPHPADERVVEALRQIRKLSGLDDVLCEGANALVMSRMADIHQHADAALAASHMPVGDGVAAIAAERRRQVEAEGWTPEHDDQHTRGELARAAACYALAYDLGSERELLWPWA